MSLFDEISQELPDFLTDTPGSPMSTIYGQSEESAQGNLNRQLGELQRQFDVSQAQMEPVLAEAVPAFGLQAAIAGVQGPEAQASAIRGLQLDPQLQFAADEGRRELESALSASGIGGGERLRRLTQFGSDLATQGLQNQFARLGSVAGTGQQTGSALAGLGSDYAQDVTGATTLSAQNAINNIMAQQQGVSGAASTGAGLAAAFLSDENKKRDIKSTSPKESYDLLMETPVKEWRYNDDVGMGSGLRIGPMYQDSPDEIKSDKGKMLNMHDEIWMIGNAVKHLGDKIDGKRSNSSDS